MTRGSVRHRLESAAYVLFFDVFAYRMTRFHFERLAGERRFSLLALGGEDLIFFPLFQILFLLAAALVATRVTVFHGAMPRIGEDGVSRPDLWAFLATTGLLSTAAVVIVELV